MRQDKGAGLQGPGDHAEDQSFSTPGREADELASDAITPASENSIQGLRLVRAGGNHDPASGANPAAPPDVKEPH